MPKSFENEAKSVLEVRKNTWRKTLLLRLYTSYTEKYCDVMKTEIMKEN